MNILFAMRDDGDMTEPMNLMLLSALAQQQGHRTRMLVLEQEGGGEDEIKRNIKEALASFKPDILGLSCITGNQKTYLAAAAEAKRLRPDLVTVFGGPHFTYFPGELMRHPDVMDILCVGEADDAWPELLVELDAGRSPDRVANMVTKGNASSALEIPGQASRLPGGGLSLPMVSGDSCVEGVEQYDEYRVRRGFVRPRKGNLDDLPFLDRHLVYDGTAFKGRFKRTHMASRGCPYRCAYCFEPQFNDLYRGSKVRQFYSVDRYLDELEYVKRNWDTRYFKFYDDVFLPFPNPEEIAWHEEFCAKYPVRIGLPFHILTRCDLVMMLKHKGINVIRDWKKAGLASLTMSIESGNRFVHDHVIVRDQSLEDVKAAYRIAREERVHTFPNTIMAIPAPLLPREDDPDFDRKLRRVGEELQMLKRVHARTRPTKPDLDELLNLVNAWTPNEDSGQRRKFIVDFMYMLGLRHDNLAPNVESVKFTLERHPGFAEFVTLAPYPGTAATEWTKARGDFDGDFEKLHASYQTMTPLACYSREEKETIHNWTFLGTFLTLFWGSWHPWVRMWARPLTWLTEHWLVKARRPVARRLYTWVYAVSKAYLHRTRIYPIKYSFREKVRFYRDMIALDFWKNWRQRVADRARLRRKLILGGPAN